MGKVFILIKHMNVCAFQTPVAPLYPIIAQMNPVLLDEEILILLHGM
jgi:hypothetical protein